jgi:hypothetical protein
MTEMNLIIPYCCVTGKYCSYGSGFVDGYLIGITTFLLSVLFYLCIIAWAEVCRGPETVESDDEEELPDNNEDEDEDEDEDEEENNTEKSDEDKKDD